MKLLLSVMFFTLAIIACQPTEESAKSSPATATSTQADETAIQMVYKQYVDKWNAADLDGVMAYIADDFVHLPPGDLANVGKEAIHSRWEQYLAENISRWESSIEYIEISGNLAFVRDSGKGSSTPKDGGETKTSVEKGVHIFRRGADGSWKIVIEIWNSNKANDEL